MARCQSNITHLFDADRITANFSSIAALFPTQPMSRGAGPASPLPQGAALELPGAVSDWIAAQSVTSLLVLKNGAIRHEGYYQGTVDTDLRMSWSVAKSVLSTLAGILFDQGAFDSPEDRADRYCAALGQSAFAGVTLQHVLQMTSGVTFTEEYHDPASDIRRLARHLGRGGSLDAYTLARDTRHAPPGEVFTYSSLDTHVLGMAIRGATGRDIPGLLSDLLIQPLGLDITPAYVTDAHGTAFVLGGLLLTTRDYARFGQMMLDEGQFNGQQIVPQAWARAATSPKAPTLPGTYGYGDQWWMATDAPAGEYLACGIYGQYIYANRQSNTLVVCTSANRNFSDPGIFEAAVAAFRALNDSA